VRHQQASQLALGLFGGLDRALVIAPRF